MEINLKEMIEYSPGGITSKVVLKDDPVNVTLFCMAAGTDMSEHTSKKKGTVHVLDGDGVFVLEGREIPMKPGVLIHLERDAVHSLSAKENTCFLLTLI